MRRWLTLLVCAMAGQLLLCAGEVWAAATPEPYVAGTINQAASATSVSVTIPSTWHVGDCLILACATSSTSVTWLTPNFFTGLTGLANTKTPNFEIYYKWGTTGDLGNTATCSTSAGAAGSMTAAVLGFTGSIQVPSCYSGSTGQQSTVASTTASTGAASVTLTNLLNLGIWFQEATSSLTWSGETNNTYGAMTDYQQTANVDIATVPMGAATPTTTGTGTSTLSSSQINAGFVTTIQPQGAATPTPTATPTPIVNPNVPTLEPYVAGQFARSPTAVTAQAVTIPATWQVGDCLLLFCTTPQSSGTWTTPTGWTSINTYGGQPYNAWYVKIAAAGDLGASVSCTYSTASGVSAYALGINGAAKTGYNSTCLETPVGPGTGSTATVTNSSQVNVTSVNDLEIGVTIGDGVSNNFSAQTNSLLGAMTDYHQFNLFDAAFMPGGFTTGTAASGTVSTTQSLVNHLWVQNLMIIPAPKPGKIQSMFQE